MTGASLPDSGTAQRSLSGPSFVGGTVLGPLSLSPRMHLWHLTPDAPRDPHRVSAGDWVSLVFGTWPMEPGQNVWLTLRVDGASGATRESRVDVVWQRNEGVNSYWRAEIGPFADGDIVRYGAYASGPSGLVDGSVVELRVGPRLHVAILWHQHQPLYRDLAAPSPRGSYGQPWVRLHAIRDYYSMAHLVAQHPGVHLTINLTPVLLWQLEDYAQRGATDRALELTLTHDARLTPAEREAILATFFDAHWHNQIFPHPRYKELFVQQLDRRPFSAQDLRDLRMWFNLAWFGKEFRDGDVPLVTGSVVSVRRFVEQARDFTEGDIEAMVAEQMKIVDAIVPLHRSLQERGQIEVSATPFFHPILPLLADTDRATVDRPGATFPPRFAHPDDAVGQVRLAVEEYERCFGRRCRGMWPAEGAVSQFILPLFASEEIRWIATDRGVLARSGRWGYDADDPDVLCQPYRAEDGDGVVSVFFRDHWLADHIGFHYQQYPDYDEAAREFLRQIKDRFTRRLTGDEERVLTVVLDGENAWGAYREDARPFLHALYGLLDRDREVRTVTFAEYLDGNTARGVRPHPVAEQRRVYDLHTGSWIDELGSAPGVDLGTWIGEPEENRAWALLAQTRDDLARSGSWPPAAPNALRAVYAAEGSDWFWWFGADQDSGNDAAFDELFRSHLRSAYRAVALTPPPALDAHIVPHVVPWTFTAPVARVQPGDRLAVQTHCAGTLTWQLDGGPPVTAALAPSGGAMGGTNRYAVTIGPLAAGATELRFRFRCTEPRCDGREICCREDEHVVTIDAAEPTRQDEP